MGRESGHSNCRFEFKLSAAFSLVILLGVVSLLADVATEGARSITGLYLTMLGASTIVVSTVAGLSELIGYGLRVVFGWMADKLGHYWLPMFIGYSINLVAVPALALAGDWAAAVCLIMIEQVGRAMRSPARDAILSYAGRNVGQGWAYGIRAALSSVGGMIGPVVIVAVMLLGGDYRVGFEVLLIPALMAVVILAHLWRANPRPHEINSHEIQMDHLPNENKNKLPRLFWIYVLAGAFIAAGYADFPLITLHIGAFTQISDGWVPVMYAIIMASNGLSALIFGRSYDKIGLLPLLIVSIVVPIFVPLVLSSNSTLIIIGMLLYGMGFGAQGSVMRAIVADMSPNCRRASAFGFYNAAFGISWFVGSVTMGMLYEMSIPAMILLSMGLQFSAVPILIHVMRELSSVPHTQKGEVTSEA